MGCHDNLDVRVEPQHQGNELLLPFKVQTDLWLVHEEHIGLIVFHQHSEQNGKHLLLACRQLIRLQHLAYLVELNLVGIADNGLARLAEQVVHNVLEHLLGLAECLSLLCRIGFATLQHSNDAVADIHLIVQILALQLEKLPVELSNKRKIHLADHLRVEQRTVDRTNHVKPDPLSLLGLHLQMNALEQMAGKLAPGTQAFHYLVENGALAHSVHTAQDVHPAVEVPKYVLGTTP